MTDPAPFWPWWAGASALGFISLGYWLSMGRPFGVSTSWARVADRLSEPLASKAEREQAATTREVEEALADDPAAFEAALLAATEDAFGEPSCEDQSPPRSSPPTASTVASTTDTTDTTGTTGTTVIPMEPVTVMAPLAWTSHLTFLAAMVVGGGLAAIHRGGHVSFALDPEFTRQIAGGWKGVVALAIGGVLVGLGTRMAGGCTSGHGLTGCARLQPASLIATATFLGVAVAISLVLARLAS